MPRTRNSFKRSADLSQEASYNAEMAEYHAQQAMYAAQEAEYYAQEAPATSYAGNRDCSGYDSRWQQARCTVHNLPEKKKEPTAAQLAQYEGNAMLWNRDCGYDSRWQRLRCYAHTLPEKKREPTPAQLAQYWGNVFLAKLLHFGSDDQNFQSVNPDSKPRSAAMLFNDFQMLKNLMDYSPYAANLGRSCDYKSRIDWAKCKVGMKPELKRKKLGFAARAALGVAKRTPVGILATNAAKLGSKVTGVKIPTADSLMNRGQTAQEAYYIGELAAASEMGDTGASAELASYYANKSIECSRLAQLYRDA